ncbi:hypothetical protein M427DRAFT_354203 [Gonapodya prolifera JEL478]|uniref:DUF4200 domain-containing protein n=1 Tax=Gonapodya prolifera (strain JEL478) TaxID=1344416 RepID=A0A139ACB5_GONPJ|nr:hypothetical protein M427DRAFT_354203 [Gonapodya prolifera JEL478]|eukprot:KXS14063.1 hypothetical protein M427DRAFT_354203 [Gonapodya prolifera JEL478]
MASALTHPPLPSSYSSSSSQLPTLPAITKGAPEQPSRKNTIPRKKTRKPKLSDLENPFRIPTDDEITGSRSSGGTSLFPGPKRTTVKALLAEDESERAFREELARKEEQWAVRWGSAGPDARSNADPLHSFVLSKRYMFLLQHSLEVKRGEMRKLDEVARAEERKLIEDERALDEDAARFDLFLKENDRNSVEAIKKAEAETKFKLDRVHEIKRLALQMVSTRSDLSKCADQLRDLKQYREFLESVAPPEWKREHLKSKKVTGDGGKDGTDDGKKVSSARPMSSGPRDRPQSADVSSDPTAIDDDLEDAEDPASLPFTHPSDLLRVFSELEETNLKLIQASQESEAALDEVRQERIKEEKRMVDEVGGLKAQIVAVEAKITEEEARASFLEERTKAIAMNASTTSHDRLLTDLHKKVRETHRKCVAGEGAGGASESSGGGGTASAQLDTLTMLAEIENRLEGLLDTLDSMPPEKVEAAEKAREKDRRRRLRDLKAAQARAVQEERVRRAMERARAPVKKQMGKRGMWRSRPVEKRREEEKGETVEEEDGAWFWN